MSGVHLAATVGPAAAYVITREWGRDLVAKADALAVAQPQVANQLRTAAAQMQEAGRRWFEAEVGTNGTSRQAGNGTSEHVEGDDASGSSRPPTSGLTTGEVAERLGVGVRRVVAMIGDSGPGSLSATKCKGAWVIDEVSVAAEIERRRSR